MRGDDQLWGGGGRSMKAAYSGVSQRPVGIMARSPSEALEPDHAPEPPRGSKKRLQHPVLIFLNTFITLLLIGVIGLAGLFYFVRTQFDKAGPLTHPTVVVIPSGAGPISIARQLERERIIADQRIFMASVLYFRAHKKLKAGEYAIKQGASIRQVLDTIIEGKAILYSVSVPEGMTSEQVVERLRANEDLVGEIAEIPPEGSLLPDTYKFSRGTSREELLRRMRADQEKFVDQIWDKRDRNLPFSTKAEAIILASIVEKETGRADERHRVAAVFVNRLRKKMRLQSDPTTIYGITGGKGPLGRPIYRSDLDRDTPYNTYKIAGLPPTPIANPGRAAIEAVLSPAKVSDLYFVADGTGGHAFAETLADHNRNVAKWRVIERERAEEAAQNPPAAAPAVTAGAATTAPAPVLTPAPNMVQVPLPEKRPAR
ncbi:MAG: endolytic transglycosylase MltG [Hyphomicrobiales bacterium]|nr:endolytic transglycosylase MltG [Hyphomicrobiales bacterium]